MTDLPPLAAVPPPAVRITLQEAEWEACIDAWTMLLGIRIGSPSKIFQDVIPKDESTVFFLSSFYNQLATSGEAGLKLGPKGRALRKLSFLLTRRILLDLSSPPVDLLSWNFLGNFCCCYSSSAALKRLLSDAWDKHHETITVSVEKAKSSVIKQLMNKKTSDAPAVNADICTLTILASTLPACGQVLMAGSDYLDTLSDAYQAQPREALRRVFVANIYVGLTSLLKSKPNLSSLLDQLFGLKATAGVGTPKTRKEPTLLSDLICSSDLLARLEKYLSDHPQKRGEDLVSSLRTYQTESRVFHHRYQKKKKTVEKGKDRDAPVSSGEELHAHRMSLVTQIQDLFPDLGSGYVIRLLDYYGDNPETVVAHLLDSSLPPELQSLDQTEDLFIPQSIINPDPMAPNSPPPEIAEADESFARKNIFDNDVDLAELAHSNDPAARSKLRFGRENDLTADDILADRSKHAANKAAIISALATFDSDDDERDDTYDAADVGGTVDTVPASTDAEVEAQNRRTTAEDLDLSLFKSYRSNPGLFTRDSATRRSQPRTSLKGETGMTDEAIEGWAVMLQRDPKRLSKLEDRLALSAGTPGGAMAQPELAPTSYRKPRADEESEESDAHGGFGGRGRGRGRGGPRGGGRGRGRGGGRGGGASGEQSTAASRQRKEENKSSRANHNRRQQRARKIARGGGLPG
ncbi:ASCC2 family CUE domain-containing protein [Aspergillus ruber CBS 135680]|uniref:Putative CUE domain protein n=1 Tax=Aspergillus ruber (strain CBS 135680) TaxID=1388766 RepID=A0A017SKV8_ASPRC|nr:putative CUE domain protein [Aspergillus ruber CBS 135680]EYE97416.1 putative CUE domain protein [Aspergillus ruber CBS 135680]